MVKSIPDNFKFLWFGLEERFFFNYYVWDIKIEYYLLSLTLLEDCWFKSDIQIVVELIISFFSSYS